jgi:hypothetical protein
VAQVRKSKDQRIAISLPVEISISCQSSLSLGFSAKTQVTPGQKNGNSSSTAVGSLSFAVRADHSPTQTSNATTTFPKTHYTAQTVVGQIPFLVAQPSHTQGVAEKVHSRKTNPLAVAPEGDPSTNPFAITQEGNPTSTSSKHTLPFTRQSCSGQTLGRA